jgi:predicted restriction endonuclease
MSIPTSIDSSHIVKAMREIDNQTPLYPKWREGRVYELRYKGKVYPPKYLVSIGNKYANGKELHGFKGGRQTNNFLTARGFTEIWNKDTGKRVHTTAEDEDFATEYPEGRQLYVRHRKLERNAKVAKAAKNKRLKQTGDLRCDVCGFSFKKRYGPLGAGFIEAHHTVPISQFKGQKITRVEDIALVCSNCHRMLHKGNPLLSIAALRKLLKSSRK